MEELVTNRSNLGRKTPSGREKRSVHTKFKLSEEALDAKEQLSDYWGVTQKEVAEMAAQLTVSFLEDEDEDTRRWFVENAYDQPGEVSRKTHVVSRETKSFLESTASDFNLTRDQFFDASLRLAHTIVRFLREVQLERHEEQLPRLYDLLELAKSIEADLRDEATDVDPLKPAVTSVRSRIEAIVSDLEDELDRDIPLGQNHEFT
ncbi:MAG: hypothetical protein BRD51_01205 [Bacteroidetes bacterium SW_11_64_17]|jgi:hypothetical protein|nr:MAG: hypothetical protein BRD33_04520 [Bacteroidetes bacterium QH_6_63_17]PSQ99963.1 MAG: hypothetical protein BRD51_01205 [Bacteroidetes bacterium SW_11_64_17]